MYDAYAQPGQKLDFNVSALGTSVVDFFVNNALIARVAPRPRTAGHL